MRKSLQVRLLAVWALVGLWSCETKQKEINQPIENHTQWVDPFIGTGGHGHTYPGATVPFGMLQPSPDNGISAWDWCSGYHYSDSITIGFSQLHLSGTGIGDLTDVRLMPINKNVNLEKKIKSRDDIPYKSFYSHQNEIATPGYYKVHLEESNITVELTSEQRVAHHKYGFKTGDEQYVVLDLGFAINWDKPTKTKIKVLDEQTITGYRHSTGWAKNQKVFFVIQFSKPVQNYKLAEQFNYVEAKEVEGNYSTAQFKFDNNTGDEIEVKVAISSVSEENALANLASGIKGFDFNLAKKNAQQIWQNNLAKIKIETPIDSLKTMFYTALYHTQVAPVTFSDANGDFRLENDNIQNFEQHTALSTLSLWDTFRAENPLLTILQPTKVDDICHSLMAYYQVNKILPVWTLYGNETNTMTGYHAIPVLVEAILKGLTTVDKTEAFLAVRNTLMQDARGLKFYKEYGYIPHNLLDESVTITLELAYNDWCAAQLAKTLNLEDDYQYFLNRSKAYQFLFDHTTGFMRGLADDGKSWKEPFDPKFSAHRVHAEYTEGNAWQHSWFVLHDVPDLINLHGGEAKFTQQLEQLFTESSEITGENVSADITGMVGQYAHGNEPSHHIAYMFNYANQPWRTQYWVREILKTQYNTTPDGLSGNEDCGQMSAWYVFSAMGLYPYNPASGMYQIGSPIFEKSSIDVGQGKTFDIVAKNVSDTNIYIQSAKLNGKALNVTEISHSQLVNGGILEFEMGSEPNKTWGVKQ